MSLGGASLCDRHHSIKFHPVELLGALKHVRVSIGENCDGVIRSDALQCRGHLRETLKRLDASNQSFDVLQGVFYARAL
jgi:hypothetical protein